MKLPDLMERAAAGIIDGGMKAIERARLAYYVALGHEQTRSLLEDLYAVIFRSVETRNVTEMVRYAKQLARDRFSSGCELYEVQTAFNVLEESIWTKITKDLAPADIAGALGLVSTVLGAGKDALAQQFVALASEHSAPLPNLRALSKGTDGV